MAGFASPAPELFAQIWDALTIDRIVPLLEELRPRPRGRHITCNCPGCGEPEAYLYEAKGGKGPHLHCNRRNHCGHEESLWEYVKRSHAGDGKAALATLVAAAGIRLEGGRPFTPKAAQQARARSRFALTPPPEPEARGVPGDHMPGDLHEKLARYQAGLPGSPAETYLIGRGLDADSAARMGFGYCQSWPQYHPSWPSQGRARLVYPLTDLHGQVVAIEGRALADVKPKSLCDGPKGAGVFAPAGLVLDDLHLCEGPFDAACLASLGLSAVALCGTSIPDWLLRAVSFRHLWAAFDADAGGDRAADTAAETLARRGSVVRRLRPPREGMDWGDYLRKAKQVRLDAIWEAKGISEAVRTIRADFVRLTRQIEYLQQNHRNRAHDRKTLLARVALDMEKFAARCDLEGGYTDPDDPFADETLLILRYHFSALQS